MAWSRKLSPPITLDDGRTFATLREAADFILELPDLHRRNPHWQLAIEAMMRAAKPASNMTERNEAQRRLKAALRREGVLSVKRRAKAAGEC